MDLGPKIFDLIHQFQSWTLSAKEDPQKVELEKNERKALKRILEKKANDFNAIMNNRTDDYLSAAELPMFPFAAYAYIDMIGGFSQKKEKASPEGLGAALRIIESHYKRDNIPWSIEYDKIMNEVCSHAS
jgi:hypothetical protein